ncbi:MAG: hypothetical protein ABI140_06930 [Jatrophihabitantaceae bacterium]
MTAHTSIAAAQAGSQAAQAGSQAAGKLSAIDTSQVKNLGIAAIVVIVLIGAVISALITKLAIRVVVLVVAVVLAVVVYQQRDRVASAARSCDATFFGVHIQPHDPDVRKACKQLGGKLGSK